MSARQSRIEPGSPACPSCHSGATVRPLAFGFPSSEMFDAAERGEIVLGGCCLPEGPLPRWYCTACESDFAGDEDATRLPPL